MVYIPVEHKSQAEPLVTVQLLRYLLRVWERDERAGLRKPRLVIPIILYHGRNPWNAPTRLGALFSGPVELRAYWPELSVTLVDLTAISEAAIIGHVRLRVALLVMRAIFQPKPCGQAARDSVAPSRHLGRSNGTRIAPGHP